MRHQGVRRESAGANVQEKSGKRQSFAAFGEPLLPQALQDVLKNDSKKGRASELKAPVLASPPCSKNSAGKRKRCISFAGSHGHCVSPSPNP